MCMRLRVDTYKILEYGTFLWYFMSFWILVAVYGCNMECDVCVVKVRFAPVSVMVESLPVVHIHVSCNAYQLRSLWQEAAQ